MAIRRLIDLLLYHGSPYNVTEPKITIDSKRSKDFGQGFYCTTSKEQATKWAKTKLRKLHLDEGFVNVYKYDKNFTGLKVKDFGLEPSIEWLDFVVANRQNAILQHDYDVIIGPVADDTAFSAIDTYLEQGDTSIKRKFELIKELKTYKLKDQILYHTEKALGQLKYIRAEKVKKPVLKTIIKPSKGRKL